jgi:DNA polymerase III delta subunit
MSKIYLITGDDEFAVKNKAYSIVKSLCGGALPEDVHSIETIHGDPDEKKSPLELMQEIIEAIFTSSLFSSDKIIWIKNFDFETITGKTLKTKEQEKDFEGLSGKFITALKSGLPDGITLVMSIFSMDKRSVLYKACSKTGEIHEFEKISIEMKNLPEILGAHISDKCSELGILLDSDARDFLIETCGANYAGIINELEKIAAAIYPEKNASIENCLDICSMTPELASWAFADAIGKKDLRSALKFLDILITPKTTELSMLYSLIGLFTDMLQIKIAAKKLGIRPNCDFSHFKSRLESAGTDAKAELMANKIFSMHPYRAFKIFLQSEKNSDKAFALAFREILKTNKFLVSSGSESKRVELESLATKLCG